MAAGGSVAGSGSEVQAALATGTGQGQGQVARIFSASTTCSGEPVKWHLILPDLRVTWTLMVSMPLFFIRKWSCL